MQKRTQSRNNIKAQPEPQRSSAALPIGGRPSRELKIPVAEVPFQVASGDVTLGGHADRGLTLAALYDTGVLERLRLDVRVRILADLTESLAWLHANPRLMTAHPHLVIAPSTIVIGLDGVARVDVRAARKRTSEQSELELDYMAPEVANGDPAADHRADIYSIGVLAWEALAGKRIADADQDSAPGRPRLRSAESAAEMPSDVPLAFGGGARVQREAMSRPKSPLRALPRASHSRLRITPPLTLPVEAEWAMPFAQVALQAMSLEAARRPQDCRALLVQLNAIDVAILASHQEIAEVVQGISAVATLCVPEPTLPATDQCCQLEPATNPYHIAANGRCERPVVVACAQPILPQPRRVPEPAPAEIRASALAPAVVAEPSPPSSRLRQLGGSYSGRTWFIAGLFWIAVLGSLAGYLGARLAVH